MKNLLLNQWWQMNNQCSQECETSGCGYHVQIMVDFLIQKILKKILLKMKIAVIKKFCFLDEKKMILENVKKNLTKTFIMRT